MKIMKKYIGIAALLLLAVGCDKGGEFVQPNPDEIRVEATVGGTRATLTEFEAGDKISLYAVEYNGEEVADLQIAGNYLNNEQMTYNGSAWVGTRTLYWSKNPCDFYGFYPYQQLGALEDILFEVATDQSADSTPEALGGYEASDLMWAKTEKVAKEDGAVRLSFQHMLSRLKVDIVRGPNYEGELPKNIEVHVYNTATTARMNWRIGSLEKYLYSPTKTIKMHQVDGDTFEAIIVPQFIERSTPLVEVTMEGIAYLLNYSMSFRPGMQHTVTVTLNTSPDQEKIDISIDGDVGDWE